WLRFMTSHPKDCSPDLLDAMVGSAHCARHLHLPFQSGSNEILSKMNRKYTREDYINLIRLAREKMPDISITSDVIVGFPGETRAQFEETLSLMREVEFTSLFTFIYSKREGTPAAEMDDPVPREEKTGRMAELLRLQEGIARGRCAAMVGTVQRVLAEESKGDGTLACRTSGNVIVDAAGDESRVGTFCDARITESKNWILKGDIIK
ncbi:MAG: radical SAM protein, partial [Oscillospiraceae bacterium]|nr:radical SAM protein [Oscillospiraceae bacterium]